MSSDKTQSNHDSLGDSELLVSKAKGGSALLKNQDVATDDFITSDDELDALLESLSADNEAKNIRIEEKDVQHLDEVSISSRSQPKKILLSKPAPLEVKGVERKSLFGMLRSSFNSKDNKKRDEEKIVNEKLTKVRLEQDKLAEKSQLKQENLEKGRLQKEKKNELDRTKIEKEKHIQNLEKAKRDQVKLQKKLEKNEIFRQEKLKQEELKQAKEVKEKQERARFEREKLKQKLETARLEQTKLEKVRLAKEKAEQERLAQERLEEERLTKEKAEQKRLAQERLEEEHLAKAKAEQKRLAQKRLEEERLAKAKAEQERLEQERLEEEHLAKAKAEQKRLAQKRLEEERLAKAKAEQERLEQERLEEEHLAKAKAEQKKLEQERLEKERLAKAKAEQERLEQERLEEERLAKAKAEQKKLEQERLEKERLAKEKAEQERLAQERLEEECLAKENAEQKRLEQEHLEEERLAKAKAEQERLAQERLEKNRLTKEKQEEEKVERERIELGKAVIKLEREKVELEKAKLELEKAKLEQEILTKEKLGNDTDEFGQIFTDSALDSSTSKSSSFGSMLAGKIRTSIKPDTDVSTEEPIILMDASERIATEFDDNPQMTAERCMLLCGDNKNIDSTDDIEKISFNPDGFALSLFLEKLDQVKKSHQVIRLAIGDVIIIMDHTLNTVYCNVLITKEEFVDKCCQPIDRDNISINELDYNEIKAHKIKIREQAGFVHSIESFIWTLSLLTSRGRLPENTDVTKMMSLKTGLDLSALEPIPYASEIVNLLNHEPSSLLEISELLDIPQKFVFAFYNAVLSLGMIEYNISTVSKAKKTFGKFFRK